MKCPECNHQNPNNAAICENCYLNFSIIQTSKLAISSLILGISSLLFFVITGLPAIILGIISIVRIKRSKGKLKGKFIALAGIIIPLLFNAIYFMLWRVDAPPIPNDYTMADLRSAPAEYDESYHLLVKLLNLFEDNLNLKDANEPLLTRENMAIFGNISNISENGTDTELADLLNENKDAIKQARDKTQKARDIIHQLNEFQEIADLTSYKTYATDLSLFSYLHFSELYKVYSMLQNDENTIDSIATELINFDSVLRKICPNVRSIGSKLACFVCMTRNMEIANNILNKPETSQKTLELLEEHFIPMAEQDLSLKNCIIYQYVYMKDALAEENKNTYKIARLTLKINSSLRLLRNHCNKIIELTGEDTGTKRQILDVWPSFYPFKQPAMTRAGSRNQNDSFRLPLTYFIYNPAGSQFLQVMNLKLIYLSGINLKTHLKSITKFFDSF